MTSLVCDGLGNHNLTAFSLNKRTLFVKCHGKDRIVGNNIKRKSVVVFDRRIKRLHKDGAALSHSKRRKQYREMCAAREDEDWIDYDYFRVEIAKRLMERLDDINRYDGFPLALDIGSGAGYLYKEICSDDGLNGVGGIGGVLKLVQTESSHDMLYRNEKDDESVVDGNHRCDTYKMVVNEEEQLPFPDDTFDLVLSSIAMHWVNDLPGLLSEVKRILKPDGCFMFAMIGGASFTELRSSLVLAELEQSGGVSPHVGPFVDFADVGNLISSAGFMLPTIDIDTIHISYPNALVLMEHIQRMGEGNACVQRKMRVSSGIFLAGACIYDDMFKLDKGIELDANDVEASIQVIYAIGWKSLF